MLITATTKPDATRSEDAPEGGLRPGVAGIASASLLADVGHEIPTSLPPSLLTSTLRAPAAALGVIEGVADGLAGAAKFGGGALADEPSAAAPSRWGATRPPPSSSG